MLGRYSRRTFSPYFSYTERAPYQGGAPAIRMKMAAWSKRFMNSRARGDHVRRWYSALAVNSAVKDATYTAQAALACPQDVQCLSA